jgi:hypothetical protein
MRSSADGVDRFIEKRLTLLVEIEPLSQRLDKVGGRSCNSLPLDANCLFEFAGACV